MAGPHANRQHGAVQPPCPSVRFVEIVPGRYDGGTGMLPAQDYLAAPANLAVELGMTATVLSVPGALGGVSFRGPRVLDPRVALVECRGWTTLARLLWRERDAVLYVNFRTPATWLAALVARRAVLVAHGPLPRSRVKRAVLAVVLRRFAALRALSRHEHDGLRAMGLGDRAVFLPLAVDGRFFGAAPGAGETAALRRRLGLGDGPVALFVANVRRVKRVDTVLRAVARLARGGRKLSLVVAGEDRLATEGSPSVARLAAALGIADRVATPGFVPPDGVRRLLHLADVFVNSSSDEAQCLAACEAAAAGRPLCLADVPSLRAAFPEARFHAPDDDAALATNLREVLDGRRADAARLAAQRRVRETSDPERVRHALAQLLLRLAGAEPRRGAQAGRGPESSAVSLRVASTE